MGRRTVRKKPMSEINVVPYIDVMLVLLVIFMTTTPLLSQGVKVNLPKAKAHLIATQHHQPIIVSVDVNGKNYLNISDHPKQPLDDERLLTRVAAELALDKQQGRPVQVLVKGDRDVGYGKVVHAMALLQQAGAPNVGLMTDIAQSRRRSYHEKN